MRIIQSENPRPLTLLALNNNGALAAASFVFGVSGDVEIWNAASGLRQFTHRILEREPHSLVFAPGGRHLVVGEWKRIRVIDVTTQATTIGPEVLYGFPECVVSSTGEIIFSEYYDSRSRLACYTDISNSLTHLIWTKQPRQGFGNFGSPAINRTGRKIAICERAIDENRAEIQTRGATTGQIEIAIPTDSASPILGLAFTADDSKLLARTESNKVQLFDTSTGAPAGELTNPGRPYVTGIAVHPSGQVACARTNGTVIFWNVEKREQIRTLDWKAGKLVSVAFSPDGALAAAGTEDGKIVVWDVDL